MTNPVRPLLIVRTSFAVLGLLIACLILGVFFAKRKETLEMNATARRLTTTMSIGGVKHSDLYWILLLQQQEIHGHSLSSVDVDRLTRFVVSKPGGGGDDLERTMAFLALCRNPSPYESDDKDKAVHMATSLLDSHPENVYTTVGCLNTLAAVKDSRAEPYFQRYRDDPRLLVHNAVAAHFKRTPHA